MTAAHADPDATSVGGLPGLPAAPTERAGGRSAVEWWRGLRPWARAVVVAVVVGLGLKVGLAGIETVTGGSGPGGPRSSSYATSGSGLAAVAQLLEDAGHPVRRLRTGLDRADLDPSGTLIVADLAGGTPAEADAVARFVAAGGRLVTAGTGSAGLLAAVAGDAPVVEEAPAGTARPLVPVPEVAGVATVVSTGFESFGTAGPTGEGGGALPILAGRRGVLAVVAAVGAGRVVALADASPLHNRLLARADNAALALGLAGGGGRPVAFAEAHHGYGTATGLDALPRAWKWAFGVGFVAVLVAMWAKGRRLGPAEVLERPLPPPRRAYVDAVAATLARTGEPAAAMAPLQAAGRRHLARLAGVAGAAGVAGVAATGAEVRGAAERAGLAEADLAALFEPAVTDDQVMAAGRALARLEGTGR